MAIVRPHSGGTIEKTDIRSMHDDVRVRVNALTPDDVDRACLGHQHFHITTNGLVLFSDAAHLTSSQDIPQTAASEGVGFTTNNTTFITSTLNQSLSGFTGAVSVLVQLNCRVYEYVDTTDVNKNPEPRVMAIFGIMYTYVNSLGLSINVMKPESVRCVHFPHNHGFDNFLSAGPQEIPVSLSCVLTFDSNEQELTSVEAVAAKISGGSSTYFLSSDKYTIRNGSMTILGVGGD